MKKIAVVTTTRAEYGLLFWTLKEINRSEKLELQLIVSGMHLSEKFGCTVNQIRNDGFNISREVEIEMDDTPLGIASSTAEITKKMAETFVELRPDVVLILGDRYEILGVAVAALMLNIPIAHIHGGEETEGAIDNQVRHAITKMSNIHFPASQKYAERIIRMGEQPDKVYMVGAPGLENIKRSQLMSREEFFQSVDLDKSKSLFLVTFHPLTLDFEYNKFYIENLLNALEKYNAQIIFTYPNSDTFGDIIVEKIREYSDKNKENTRVYKSMGQIRYLSSMKYAQCMIGNSSSGIIEAPFFKLPVVNIGDRQKGRIMADNIVQADYSTESIIKAIDRCMYDTDFRSHLDSCLSPYGCGDSSVKIVEVLENIELNSGLLKKRMTY